MSDRVPCSACGASILVTTAQKNEGLCMPCKGGYRAHIEASKVRREEEKRYQESAERKHWHWLVVQVGNSGEGFASLSRANQIFFATNLLIGEVYNGGFEQYFHNSSADYFSPAIEGLNLMQAWQSLDLLMSAKTLIFGELDVPASTGQRRKVLQVQDQELQAKLDGLDKVFWTEPDRLAERMARYVEEHGLLKGF